MARALMRGDDWSIVNVWNSWHSPVQWCGKMGEFCQKCVSFFLRKSDHLGVFRMLEEENIVY